MDLMRYIEDAIEYRKVYGEDPPTFDELRRRQRAEREARALAEAQEQPPKQVLNFRKPRPYWK